MPTEDQKRRRRAASKRHYDKTGGAAQQRFRVKHKDRLKVYLREYGRKAKGLPAPTHAAPARCECCGGLPNGKGTLHLDHDHVTGRFRGWLCYRCNMGIGLLGDCVHGVACAVDYLLRAIR